MKFQIPGPGPAMPTHLQSSKTQANDSVPLLKTCPTFLNKACPLPRPRSGPRAPQGQEPRLTQAVSKPQGRPHSRSPQITRTQKHGQCHIPVRAPTACPPRAHIHSRSEEKTMLLRAHGLGREPRHALSSARTRPAPRSRPAARAPTRSGCAVSQT